LEVIVSRETQTFSVNDRIVHHVYGPGSIKEINPRLTTIEFDTNGRRKFVTSMVRLEHTDVAAPEIQPKARSKKPKTTKK
jgi:hypothetical protein